MEPTAHSLKTDKLEKNHAQFGLLGIIISMGIVYGDIGTSPLYVMNALIDGTRLTHNFIVGAISCVIWTLTLQTTIKYVLITLKADNNGEGGIFSLYALLRKKKKNVYVFAIIGGATFLANGVLTPSITVTSAVEGLKSFNPELSVIPIVIAIFVVLFFSQQFGTKNLGKSFGPIMLVWFSVIGILGILQILNYPAVLEAFNPYYVYVFLSEFPEGILLLGAVFLCTTGAEALYSDLGHCGYKNIKISWIFVKTTLILNYLGQGAWVLTHKEITTDATNPFYTIMPEWFLLPGIILATLASIIASQALLSGTFTLISEAIQLNFWPKLKIEHPTEVKGQMYIPFINWLLFVSCCFVEFYFVESAKMEAAYGLAITITMIITTILVTYHLRLNKKRNMLLVLLFLLFFLTIEITFLFANMNKFVHGGWFTIALSLVFAFVMYVWFDAREIKKRYMQFTDLRKYLPAISDLQKDEHIPYFTQNLVYLTKADNMYEIENKITYSILNKFPKRAHKYWFIHINYTDEPSTMEYFVTQLIPNIVFRIDFILGFRISPKVNILYRKVIEDLIRAKEIDIISNFPSLRKHQIQGDFKFVLIDRIHTHDFDLKFIDMLIMKAHELINNIGIPESKAFGLDTSVVIDEKVPLHHKPSAPLKLTRVKIIDN
ncbi:MAG TPA: KUP/HAK/KT family potassium transporter [Candidatus Kapabacteria bacterium]|nr:KUP/HAK/KT family potassium transporter [Candidatus Kapabacteria bacterium]